MKFNLKLHSIYATIKDYNLFMLEENDYEDEPKDPVTILQHQKYTTRLYVILLMCSVYILFYTNLSQTQRRTVIIENIDLNTFNQLYLEYEETLSCPCSEVTISYETFVSNNVIFHDICSSFFVTQQWIEGLYMSNANRQGIQDFRTTASAQFALLSKLCLLSQDYINENLIDFNSSEFISIYVQPEYQVEIKVNEAIESMKNILLTRMNSFINYLRIITRRNYFISAFNTNAGFAFYFDLNTWQHYIIGWQAKNYFSLTNVTDGQYFVGCASGNPTYKARFSSSENQTSVVEHIYWFQNTDNSPEINGFFVGCTSFEALLQSTLNCLYDIECLQLLVENFPNLKQQGNINLTSLVISKQNEYISVLNLLNNLLINQWSTKVYYSNYFYKCAPSYCTYVRTDQIYFWDAVTLFISLYGGLIIILRLITPFLINISLKLREHFRNTNNNISTHHPDLQTFIQWIGKVNLFKMTTKRTEHDIKRQKIVTRVYVGLLTGSVLILLLFNILKTQTIMQTVSHPSLTTYYELQSMYFDTLKCTCSNTAISYKTFISLSVSLHQVCSSDLLSNRWISILNKITIPRNEEDWRNVASSEFQLLSDLCQLAKKTIDDSIHRFLLQSFIASNMITETDFNTQFNATFSQFTNSIMIYFNALLQTVELTNKIDQSFMGKITDIYSFFDPSITYESSSNQIKFSLATTQDLDTGLANCICAIDNHCRSSIGFYNSTLLLIFAETNAVLVYKIPGLVTGCSPIDSLLLSTLECFYSDAECFSIVLSYIKKTYMWNAVQSEWFDIQPLIYNSTSTRFPPNTSILEIVQNVMIEQWQVSFSYKDFYETCSPTYCTYTQFIRTNTIIEIIIVFVSMIGGLVFLLRLITPYLVTFIFRFMSINDNQQQIQQQQQQDSRFTQLKNKIRTLPKFIFQTLLDLNVFARRDLGSNIDQITAKYLGQWATRLYLLLLIISFIVLTLYSLIKPVVITKTFQEPSFNSYNQLIDKYGDKLKCSCQLIAFKYDQFVQIQSEFHEICSSPFASNEWRTNFTSNLIYNISNYHQRDYRRIFSAHLQFLNGLCELSTQSVSDAIDEFVSSLYVTVQLTSEIDFNEKLSTLIEQVKSNSSNTIRTLFFLIRSLNHGNGIISTYRTNFEYISPPLITDGAFIPTQAIVYDDNCSCDLRSNCTSQANFILADSLETSIPLQGLKIGCLPTESFRSSTLECFYNQSCVNLIQQYIDYNGPSISALSKISRFSTDTTIDKLLDNTFIEEWKIQIDYLSYFKKCSPSICAYTYVQRVDIVYTITFLLGIQGGLMIVLKWISPKIVRIIYSIYRRKKQTTIVPFESSIQISHITTSESISTNPLSSVQSIWKTISICLTAMCLITFIILFSIYTKQEEQKATLIINSTFSMSLNSTVTIMTTTTAYQAICEAQFELIELEIFDDSPFFPLTLTVGDFNNDNMTDIVFSFLMNTDIYLSPGNGDGTFAAVITSSTIYFGEFGNMLVHDINNDNNFDIAFIDNIYYYVGIILGNGDGTFESRPVYLEYINLRLNSIGFADFNSDTYLDMARINYQSNEIYLYTGYGNGSFSLEQTLSLDPIGMIAYIYAADLNNDGYFDISFTYTMSREVGSYLGYGNGSFQAEITSFTGGGLDPYKMSFADFNNDTLLDIIISYTPSEFGIMIGFGNGSFGERKLLSINQGDTLIQPYVHDFNNDGYSDIIFTDVILFGISILYGKDNGDFNAPTTIISEVNSLTDVVGIADFNNDGYSDIAFINAIPSYIKILLNKANCNST